MKSFAALRMTTVHTPSRRPTFRPPRFSSPEMACANCANPPDVPSSAVQVLARDPEHLAFALLGVEPKEGQPGERRFEWLAAAADLAEGRAVRREGSRRLLQDTAHQIETGGACGQRQARLAGALRRPVPQRRG